MYRTHPKYCKSPQANRYGLP
uniref:Uncharacterized protein n=1 Tax=Anguilla anguilla TaxID=7936 RepID=A0A0E9U8D5_ANGAN